MINFQIYKTPKTRPHKIRKIRLVGLYDKTRGFANTFANIYHSEAIRSGSVLLVWTFLAGNCQLAFEILEHLPCISFSETYSTARPWACYNATQVQSGRRPDIFNS